jgi:hypothetical protein
MMQFVKWKSVDKISDQIWRHFNHGNVFAFILFKSDFVSYEVRLTMENNVVTKYDDIDGILIRSWKYKLTI